MKLNDLTYCHKCKCVYDKDNKEVFLNADETAMIEFECGIPFYCKKCTAQMKKDDMIKAINMLPDEISVLTYVLRLSDGKYKIKYNIDDNTEVEKIVFL